MVNYEKLINAGIDVNSLLQRLLGNASLVGVLLKKFAEDTTFSSLETAFAVGDSKGAEMAAHTLKGMCGNLSLTRLYELFTEQVNCIRSGNFADASAMMAEIALLYDTVIAGIHAWLAEQ